MGIGGGEGVPDFVVLVGLVDVSVVVLVGLVIASMVLSLEGVDVVAAGVKG